jgi:hypothetical protein
MSVKDRIKMFIYSQKLTISAFEVSILASNGYVNSISKSIGLDKLEKIIEKYPNLNITWLLTGNGEMILNNSDNFPGLTLIHDSDYCSICAEKDKRIKVLEALIEMLKDKVHDLESKKTG